MADPLTIVVQAAMISALYALVAIGFTLIFGVGGVLNLAHGATLTIGAFSAYYAVNALGLGLLGAVATAAVVPALFGAGLYFVLIRKFRDDPIIVMILTLVVTVAVESLFLVVEGTSAYTLPQLLSGNTTVAGASVSYNLVAIFALSWVIIGAVFYWVNRTDTGRAILATSMDGKGAFLVGIDTGRVNLLMWVVASVLAGLAGYFLGSHLTIGWSMGRTPFILSFAIVILGGLGSVKGSVVGAYVIGTIEVLTTNVLNPQLQGLAPLVVVIIVLLVRPSGLYGTEVDIG
ncbi:ABC transporter permease subunit [Halobellus sp. GM3]|uniref:ABC transporter permease subunit n=1 Tax=Halobellus sp. GM3 TaxID=3458410 RepID=UPI00403D8FA8